MSEQAGATVIIALILIIVFSGEPDLSDAIIQYFTKANE